MIKLIMLEAHRTATEKGWHEKPLSFGDQIANMHAELSEAWEDHRSGKDPLAVTFDDLDSKPHGIPVELADVIIRIADTCQELGIDLDRVIEMKMRYNKSRAYKHDGKVV